VIDQGELLYNALSKNKIIMIVILDACRFDFFEEVNDIKGNLRCVQSRGSSTPEWLKNTWIDFYDKVAYVTANPYVNDKPNDRGWNGAEHFPHIEKVWDWGWTEVKGVPTVPAENVNKGVKKVVEMGYKKIIAHYMQPHPPYIGKITLPIETFVHARFKAKGVKNAPVDKLRYWNVDIETLRLAYKYNLEYVLEKGVKPLLSEFSDFKIIVTADHGELLGEYSNFGHPDGVIVPELRHVPFLEVE